MEPIEYLSDDEWVHVLSLMPKGWEESAREKLALRRRRAVCWAGDLLRMCLAYGLCDLSLRELAAWATTIRLGEMSKVAVMKRLQGAGEWLGHLVGQWLLERGLGKAAPGFCVRIVDATALCGPGGKGTEWRIHLRFDLGQRRITGVEVTDEHEGETLQRHTIAAGEVVLADRGYTQGSEGIVGVLERGGHVVVRVNWKTLGLTSASGKPVDMLALLRTLRSGEVGDWEVCIGEGAVRRRIRLVAVKKTRVATERERERLRHRARRKGYRLQKGTLVAAGYVLVLTDLPRESLSAVAVLELYRLRWQVELAFKRMKSLLHLGKLRARKPELAQTYLLAKILGALVVEELSTKALSFFPWGFRLPAAAIEPVAALRAVG